ncbi:MAG: T9SS type A sorting domain-containing protein [Saprospirales bacterium]|nr:T9SS type A sorting domain-containing protein [Saprospirales bacterium]
MGKRNKLIIGFYGALLSGVLFMSYDSNPPDGYSGAPGDSLCSSCHDTPPAGVDGTISLTGLPSTVSLNTTYNLTITSTVTLGSPSTAGFQLVALNSTNQNSGNLSENQPDVGTETSGGREYVEHRGDKNIIGGTVSWDFQWTSPLTGSGLITMYAASNLTNNNNSDGGDRVISNIFTTTIGSGSNMTVAITNSVNVSCFGGNNGSATAQASNGTPPYTYMWSNGQSGATATNLIAGTYTVTASDGAGGTATTNVTITQPPNLIATIVSTTPVNCFGGNNGVAVAGASGGTPPYTYTWSNGQTGAAIFNLVVGNYTVTVKDSKNCTKTAVANITQPSLLVVNTVSQNNVSCFGGNNGSAVVNATGGSPGYNYNWSNGTVGPIATNLSAGTYTVTTIDSHGCMATKAVTITQPTVLVASIPAVTQVDCFGEASGSATASAGGGTPGYSYLWSNGANTATANGLAAGSYTVTVTDTKGCTDTESVAITQPAEIGIDGAVTNATCNGNCDGSISISVTGGDAPFAFIWIGPGGPFFTEDISGLCAGDFTVEVTDANGCTAMATFTVDEPALVGIEVGNLTHVDCNGNATGSVAVSASGEPGPFSYLWSNGATTPDLSGLVAGSYSVTATNGLSCTGSATIVITQPAMLDANVSVTHESGSGANDGTATSNPTGGTSPYSYVWSTGAITSSITGLAPGNYTVTVEDANGCTAIKSVAINSFDCALTLDLDSTPVNCSGGNNGTATANSIGGTSPFSFTWSNGGSTATISGLEAGTYSVTVVDDSDCTATGSVEVLEPSALEASATILEHVACFGDATGSASVLASGGSPEPNYTYVWGDSIGIFPPGVPFVRDDLPAGAYFVVIIDGNNCETTINFTINQPPLLIVTASSTDETANDANDGTASATVQGGTPGYTYQWSNGATTPNINGLSPGLIHVSVTDANGCTAVAETTVDAFPCTLTLEMGQSDVQCNGAADGTANAFAANGVEPYSYEWSNGSDLSSISGLAPGIYSVSVLDAANCPAIGEVTISEPDPLVVTLDLNTPVTCHGDADGFASVLATGGIPPYSFAWSNGTTGPEADNLAAGTYTVTVFDANLCAATLEVVVTQPDPIDPQASSTNETANGAGDGTASVDPIGGTGPYDILWNTGETTATITGLVPGVYSAIVTDVNGCSAEESVAVNPFDCSLTVTVQTQHVSCKGGSDGSLLLAVTGATDPVEVTVNGVIWQGGDLIPDLAAGIYDIVVSDASFCVFTQSFEVLEPSLLELAVTDLNDLICAGFPTGSVSVLASGGTGAYTYQWADNLPGNDLSERTDLPGGTYSVTASDANGCEASLSVLIEETQLEWGLVAILPVECPGEPTGFAELNVFGGTEPYDFQWPNGGTGPSQSGLSAGVYFVSITDANDCSVVADVEITALDQEDPMVVTQDLTLFIGNDGHATLEPADLDGGSSDNCGIGMLAASQTHFDCSHLGANSVQLTVTDSNGNEASGTAQVNVLDTIPPALICPPDGILSTCNGTLVIVNYPITAADNCSAQNPVLTGGLPSGSVFPVGTTMVSWMVADQSGNTGECSFVITVIETILEVFIPAFTNTCPGQSDGSATVVPLNGVPPYDFLWDDPQGQMNSTATGLAAGTYNVTVTDALGCIATEMVVIGTFPAATIQVQSVEHETNGEANGSIDITVTGGTPPFTYEWSKNGIIFTGAEDPDGLSEGEYTVEVTDANGCVFASETIVVDNITAVGEVNGKNHYRVFPNPASEVLWIEWTGPSRPGLRAELMDIHGTVRLQAPVEAAKTKLSTDQLAPGVYLLRLYADGWQTTQKVLILK